MCPALVYSHSRLLFLSSFLCLPLYCNLNSQSNSLPPFRSHTLTQNGKQLAAFTSFYHCSLSLSLYLPPSLPLPEYLKASTLFLFFHSPLRPAISPHLRFQFVHSQAHFCDDSTRKPNKLYHLYYLLVSVYMHTYYVYCCTQVSASFHIKYDTYTTVYVVKLKNERDHTRIHKIKQPSQAKPSQVNE